MPASPTENIETERLSAERLGTQHLAEIAILHRDPRVMKTLSADGKPIDDDKTRQALVKSQKHWDDHGFGLWIFRDKDSGEFVGRGGLSMYEIEGEDIVGLAYAIEYEHWGKGYATEIAAVSIKIGFEKLGLKVIGSWALPFNSASKRVMEKIGMTFEKRITYADLPHDAYRILRSRYEANLNT